jgi:tRNA pseudouridine55 synthase
LSGSDNERLNSKEQGTPAGVLAIDKPEGWTSFDVVAVVRKVVGVRRTGHGGTLDPLATGVLPVLIGSATKFTERLHTATKVYVAVVRFGHETETDDREGKMTRVAPPPSRDVAERALAGFRGVIEQRPPAYAAVKVAGRPAYARARAGEQFDLAARKVQVLRLDVTDWSSDAEMRLLVVCSSGTYVRSLARDVGRAASSAAHLSSLRRLAVGALEAQAAVPIDTLRREGHEAAVARLREPSDALLVLSDRYLSAPADRLVSGEAVS